MIVWFLLLHVEGYSIKLLSLPVFLRNQGLAQNPSKCLSLVVVPAGKEKVVKIGPTVRLYGNKKPIRAAAAQPHAEGGASAPRVGSRCGATDCGVVSALSGVMLRSVPEPDESARLSLLLQTCFDYGLIGAVSVIYDRELPTESGPV
ncbi:hypothetical protein MRX96_002990 [Rhipicephalus microplus]